MGLWLRGREGLLCLWSLLRLVWRLHVAHAFGEAAGEGASACVVSRASLS